MPGVFVRIDIGRAGTSSANARYITRGSATGFDREAIVLRNYPEPVREAGDYRDFRDRIEEFCAQEEMHELESPRRGGGETRTHYRAVLSFEGKVETERASGLADEYLERTFPDSRAVAAVHQDTDHTHVHVHIQAREVDGGKLHFDRDTYRQLDREWVQLYGREFGHEKADEHEAKKTETRSWRALYAEARTNGHAAPPAPERAEHGLEANDYHQREERNHGADQARAGGLERGASGEEPGASERESRLEELAEERDRAVQAADRTADEARATVRAAETALDREHERDDGRVEERDR